MRRFIRHLQGVILFQYSVVVNVVPTTFFNLTLKVAMFIITAFDSSKQLEKATITAMQMTANQFRNVFYID